MRTETPTSRSYSCVDPTRPKRPGKSRASLVLRLQNGQTSTSCHSRKMRQLATVPFRPFTGSFLHKYIGRNLCGPHLADSRHVVQLLHAAKPAMFLSIGDDALGRRLANAGIAVSIQASMVQIQPRTVDPASGWACGLAIQPAQARGGRDSAQAGEHGHSAHRRAYGQHDQAVRPALTKPDAPHVSGPRDPASSPTVSTTASRAL